MYRILFGEKPDWGELIRSRLDRNLFKADFCDLRSGSPEEYDCVVPLLEEHYAPLRALPAGVRRNFFVPRPAAEAIAGDKLETVRFLSAAGFGRYFPAIYADEVKYPFVYKKRSGRYGQHVEIIFTPDQQATFEARIDRDCYFKQRHVEGAREYTAHFIAVNGILVFSKCYWFDFDGPYFVKGRRYPHSDTGEAAVPFPILFRDILRKLDFTGTCCFNFKLEMGTPRIFEINPRFGASLCRDINAYLKAYLGALQSMR